ncbi:MAG: hypothetical protein WAK11_03875 [Candidatus Cybelea sp.]|jgi:hypothetical protein
MSHRAPSILQSLAFVLAQIAVAKRLPSVATVLDDTRPLTAGQTPFCRKEF